MRNTILSLVLIIGFFSCKEQDPMLIDSSKKSDYFDLATYYQATDYLGLSFPDSVNLIRIRSSKVKNDKLYIHDNGTHQILVFDLKNESYLYSISNIGEGPEEYQMINDFDVDVNDILYIYDYGRKIISFKDGQFLKEWNNLKLYARGFQKTKNGFLLMVPDNGYDTPFNPIVEIDENSKVLNAMGGELMEKLTIPVKYFQRIDNSIYINNMHNRSIVKFNEGTGIIDSTKFNLKNNSSFSLIDFWQVNSDDFFLMTVLDNDELKAGLIPYFKDNKFVSNYSSFLCSLDLLAMSSFPTNDDKGKYDYSLMTEEFFPSFDDYLKNITVEMGGSLELDGDYYSFKDYKLEKDKFEANRTKIQGILSSDKILIRKYIRK